MSGYLLPERGDVYINGVNLYQNFDFLKQTIGYVPQSDIVYDNLTLHDMLSYTAKLRLPKDITAEEREAAIGRSGIGLGPGNGAESDAFPEGDDGPGENGDPGDPFHAPALFV